VTIDDDVNRYIQLTGRAREYVFDPAAHLELTIVRQVLSLVDDAMRYEDVPPSTRRRVVNAVLWGDPEGFRDDDRTVRPG
jgi:hypothetical protein